MILLLIALSVTSFGTSASVVGTRVIYAFVEMMGGSKRLMVSSGRDSASNRNKSETEYEQEPQILGRPSTRGFKDTPEASASGYNPLVAPWTQEPANNANEPLVGKKKDQGYIGQGDAIGFEGSIRQRSILVGLSKWYTCLIMIVKVNAEPYLSIAMYDDATGSGKLSPTRSVILARDQVLEVAVVMKNAVKIDTTKGVYDVDFPSGSLASQFVEMYQKRMGKNERADNKSNNSKANNVRSTAMTTPGWDAGRVYYTNVVPGTEDDEYNAQPDGNPSPAAIERRFLEFLRTFRIDNNFVYRDQLRQNLIMKLYFLEVDLAHLISFDEALANKVKDHPAEYLPWFENAVKVCARQSTFQTDDEDLPECQVMLLSNANPIPLRDLDSTYISKLIRIPGIIIAASSLGAKATHIHVMCKSCRHTKVLPVKGGFAGIELPRKCDGLDDETGTKDCPLDPYEIIHDKSKFVDQQSLKLQELHPMVPVGELPRHMLLSADRYLTNKVVPGTRVTVTGIYSIFSHQGKKRRGDGGAPAIKSAYIRVVGMQVDVDGASRNSGVGRTFTEEEEETFIKMSQRPNLYEEFSKSIAPSIYGSADIKKAVACLLFGGSTKILPDGMRLRGDINVLLLGDPGTAKSQLLKFAEQVAPIGVYTSGKGSSAAGLTASVVRDSGTREFYLEGGAMVLADGGVVCIDEFDKMREEDRVAIHEAMEQQTISIAKAGITTILNSRTAVLAAANPVFGRYDDMKAPGENIDFQSTILSRFDLIFIVKDEHNIERDMTIAKHVMNVHINRNVMDIDVGAGDIDVNTMRSYISYCKA
ncbi:minichromosome maintenance protein 5 [Quaeritorhiza haematococci]|nr:minichromosome maintenance protein 5 [Quaeritorhiza haematococci]